MSASGLVHVRPGEAPADASSTEFIPLGAWLREAAVYNVMRQMRVFRMHRIRKAFRTWRNHTHAAVVQRMRSAIQRRLFYAKPQFTSLLMDVRRHVHGACSVGLMPFQPPCQVGSNGFYHEIVLVSWRLSGCALHWWDCRWQHRQTQQ
jgi:hypothetical protein